MSIELEPKGKVFVVILIILGSAAFFATRTTPENLPPEFYDDSGYQPGTIKGFYKTPPQDIEQLINNNPAVVVIDCSSSSSNFMSGKKLPKAMWSTTSSVYYGQNVVLVIYATDDNSAVAFAKDLIGKMYGQVHVLLGGYDTWNEWINV